MDTEDLKVLKVGKDEHLVILIDNDGIEVEHVVSQISEKFPKLKGRVMVMKGKGIKLAKV